MKKFNKAILSALTVSTIVMSGVAMASDDNVIEELRNEKASVTALSDTLKGMGATVDESIDLNPVHTFSQELAAYEDKHAELQDQFNALRNQ